ncbi:MAG: hypothetical protein AB7F59_03675 [Bdellovibrionales bacterium]
MKYFSLLFFSLYSLAIQAQTFSSAPAWINTFSSENSLWFHDKDVESISSGARPGEFMTHFLNAMIQHPEKFETLKGKQFRYVILGSKTQSYNQTLKQDGFIWLRAQALPNEVKDPNSLSGSTFIDIEVRFNPDKTEYSTDVRITN